MGSTVTVAWAPIAPAFTEPVGPGRREGGEVDDVLVIAQVEDGRRRAREGVGDVRAVGRHGTVE